LSEYSAAQELSADTKQCPECAEIVKFEARICRFCGHEFWTLPWAETEDTRVPRVAAAREQPAISPSGDRSQRRPKSATVRSFDWALHPVAALIYPVVPFLVGAIAGAPRVLPYAVAAVLSLAAVVLVHYDRRAMGDPSSWWPVMVFFTGPFAYLPYAIMRRTRVRKMTWALVAWSFLMGVWAIGAVVAAKADCARETGSEFLSRHDAVALCQAGGMGAAAVLFVVWFVGFIILSIIWFMSRPRELVVVGTQGGGFVG